MSNCTCALSSKPLSGPPSVFSRRLTLKISVGEAGVPASSAVGQAELGVDHRAGDALDVSLDVLVEVCHRQQRARAEVPLETQVRGLGANRIEERIVDRAGSRGGRDGRGRRQVAELGARHDFRCREAHQQIRRQLEHHVQRRQRVAVLAIHLIALADRLGTARRPAQGRECSRPPAGPFSRNARRCRRGSGCANRCRC